MSARPLSRQAVSRWLSVLRAELGRADRGRLDGVFGLIGDDGRIRLGDALQTLFPDQPHDAALTAFRQFRARIGKAAEDAGVRLALNADTQTRTEPGERWAWFEGDDAAAQEAARQSEAETEGVTRSAQDALAVVARSTPRAALSVVARPIVRYFVSYAHEDKSLAADLLERLGHCLGAAKDYRFRRWQDRDIILGTDWHEAIQQAIRECDFGLLLVSPAFLASRYIRDHELPHFVVPDGVTLSPGKRAAPVALQRVSFDGTMDLRGLERRQVFLDSDRKAYAERGGQKRDAFAHELFAQVVRMLRAGPPAAPPPVSKPEPEDAVLFRHLREHMEPYGPVVGYVPSPTRPSSMDKLDEAERGSGERGEVLQMLLQWARNPNGEPYCALLGELGMGKTTNAMAFTRALLQARENDPEARLPIFLDLRLLGDAATRSPDLTLILDTALRGSWKGGAVDAPLQAAEAIRLVREQGAVVIFDGLDEVLVRLTAAGGQHFVHELFRILPPNLVHPDPRKPQPRGRLGRVLLTCRTHYFRTVRDRKTFLTAEDRDRVRADDYRVLILLPFEESQIRAYLAQTLPGTDPDRVLETIRAVHNLSELASRPYTLSLITGLLPRIERWKLEGRRVRGTDLYREMVLSWLERDTGKHQLTPDHKQRLMEQLAAAFWCSERRDWQVGEVEQWLVDLFRSRPDFAAHYEGKDREVLKEDLRTATFLVDIGEDRFRFAHTSLLEYFLAAFLLRALREGRPEAWDMPRPSDETFDFLCEMLAGERDGTALATMRTMQAVYRPRVSERLLAYLLRAAPRGYPTIPAGGMRLDGADLRGWSIAGASASAPFVLRGANLRGARLAGAEVRHVDLGGADLNGADLTCAEILESGARGACFEDGNLTGTVFRQVDLREARFRGARRYRTQLLCCEADGSDLSPAVAPSVFAALCRPDSLLPPTRPDGPARVDVFAGHAAWVWSVAFDPAGARLASAGADGTVRLWDAASGAAIAALRGHQGRVLSVAFDPAGARLASAGDDGTVRLWEAGSGAAIAALRGHAGGLWSVAFDPTGARLASAGDDGTVRLWDAAIGAEIATLRGHAGGVWSVAFDPSGARLASAGHDGTVRLWDAASGAAIAALRGHDRGVWSVAFDPAGARLASAGDDGTVRLWNAASGAAIAALRGHDRGVWSVAFDRAGTRLASAGADRTVRLWDAASGAAIAALRGHERWVWSVGFDPSGARLASAGEDGAVRLWDAGSGAAIAALPVHEGRVWSVGFDPSGARLAFAGDDGTVRLWDAASGAAIAALPGHQGLVLSVGFDPSGARFASAGADGTVRLWDAASGAAIAALPGHEGEVFSVAFDPSGARLASAGTDGTVRLWDGASGAAIAALRGHEGRVLSVAFDPAGAHLASAGNDGTVRLWDAANGAAIAALRGHKGGVWSAGFDPAGARLASAGEDGAVRLWDAASGGAIAALRGHEGRVWCVAFDPAGARLASAGDDGTVRLWDATTGTALLVRHHFADGAWAAIEPAGNRVLHTGGEAWRWLGWNALGPDGTLTRYPAEIFGPLPGPRA
jgi:WD40 repeat protein